MYSFTLRSLFFVALSKVASSVAADEADDMELLTEVLEWTRSGGGFISDKVEIKPIAGDLSGIYAKETLKKGEIITVIPFDLILRPSRGEAAGWCDKVEGIRAAIAKDPHNQSPYEMYLAKRSRKHIPAFWFQTSRDLLLELVDDCFVVDSFTADIEGEWEEECPSALDDRHLDAMMLLQTRGEGPYSIDFIPIHDLLNHRNGKHTNVDPKYDEEKGYRIITTREVKAGEQLQNTYNQCEWCEIYSNPPSDESFQVTPQIFELYGFVELMPQRWVIPSFRMMFDIDEVDPEDAEYPGELEVSYVVPPSRAGLNFLRHRLDFLKAFETKHKYRTDIPRHELEDIFAFHSSIVTAFSAALQQAGGHTVEDVWRLGRYWYEEDEDEEEEYPKYGINEL